MPRALAVPWQVIMARYIAGARPSELGREYGVNPAVITKRANRNGWVALRSESAKDVSRAVQTSLTQQSDNTRTKLARAISKHADRLQELPTPRSIAGLREHVETAKTLVAASSGLFGWDREQERRVVNVHLLASVDTNSLGRTTTAKQITGQIVPTEHNQSCANTQAEAPLEALSSDSSTPASTDLASPATDHQPTDLPQ